MSVEHENGQDGGREDDLLAAEYVLGVLDDGERRQTVRRIGAEPDFAARIAYWEDTLAVYQRDYASVEAPARIKQVLESRLFPEQELFSRPAGLWHSLAFWRGLAFASLAAFAIAAVLATDIGLPGDESADGKLMARLEAEGSPMSLAALYDPAAGTVEIMPVASGPREQSLELWLIVGDNPPMSLGIMPPDGRGEIEIAPEMREHFAEGATLAVSLEPAGGSPTGQPTGPVVAAGTAHPI